MLHQPAHKTTETLVDPYGRTIDYVRLSVTDRCDFRCVYCMPKDIKFLPKPEVLSLEELERLASTLIEMGVRKIRITGGEPLVRKGILSLFQSLGAFVKSGELAELTLTTNASQLKSFAAPLFDTGVRRINVSLDSLNPETFARIARPGNLGSVMAGIKAALEAGLKLKINTVALKGVNDHEISNLVAWCGERGMDLSLIEMMPVGAIDGKRSETYLPLPKLKEALERDWTLEKSDYHTAGPSRYYTVAETGQKIGFITPLSENFCASCNRIRITCTGTLYMCLGQSDKADLREVLRGSTSNEPLKEAIRAAIAIKPKAHDFNKFQILGTAAVARNMNVTGG